MTFKKEVMEISDDDPQHGAYIKGLKKFYLDPVATFKRSIAKKEKLIEKYKRLIKKYEKSIKHLNLLIESHEEK